MVARDRPYSELKDELVGKKVVIWTCNTCARLCNNIGGNDAAERLAAALEKDGVEILGILSTSASCLEGKVRAKEDKGMMEKADVVLSMTCNIGALCAERVFGKEVLNPLVTVGAGFVGEDRSIFVCDEVDGKLVVKGLSEVASERGLWCDPYV